MDKKSLIGLIIIGVILFGFTLFSSKQQAEYAKEKAKADSIFAAQNPTPVQNATTIDMAAADSAVAKDSLIDSTLLGVNGGVQDPLAVSLLAASKGENRSYTVENDLIKINFATKGGIIESVELKDYKTYKGKPLMLFNKQSSQFDLSFFIKQNFNNIQVNTANYFFTAEGFDKPTFAEGEKEKSFIMRLNIDSVSHIDYIYKVYKDNYMIDFDVKFVGMESLMAVNQSDMTIVWSNIGLQNEKGFDNENNYTTIAYNYPTSESIEELGMSKESKQETINSRLKWVAFKQQFFSSVFVAKNDFQNGEVEYTTFKPTDDSIKRYYAKLSVPYSPTITDYSFNFYFGPNKFSTLKKYDLHFEKLVPLGGWIIGWVNRYLVIPVFDVLGNWISNYGIIILLLTIIIKIIISPLTYKSYLSTAKMRLLKPDIDKLTEKFPKQEDALKKQQATMELYKSAGVSPMGGCLPMLIQFPILIAMFRFFPASIELRGEHFLWADDLSSYDSILNLPFDIPFYGSHVSLFALLMCISIYVTSKINYTQTASAAPQMAGMKFMMLYMMPVMMLFWFNNYSSGLSYYYLVSNIFTIGQTYAFRYAIDDKKLHEQMKQNAKKPRKKSKWSERYEEMLKQQQQMRK